MRVLGTISLGCLDKRDDPLWKELRNLALVADSKRSPIIPVEDLNADFAAVSTVPVDMPVAVPINSALPPSSTAIASIQSNAVGAYGISRKIVLQALPALSRCLPGIFNHTFDDCVFPVVCKASYHRASLQSLLAAVTN